MATAPEHTAEIDSWRRTASQATAKGEKSLRRNARKASGGVLVFPDDPAFQAWSVLIALLLVYSILVTPFRIAFVDVDNSAWVVVDTVVDFLFFGDLLVSCVLVFEDEESNLITGHKRIFVHYLRTWFVVDLAACVPLQLILDSNTNVNSLVRIARVSRIYKIARMFRIVRTFKLMKSRHQIIRYMNSVFKISLGVERLFWFVVTLVLVLHLMTCSWVFIGRLNMDSNHDNWIAAHGYTDLSNTELYIVSLYWTVTTVATVGYGDIHARNTDEMAVNCVIMLLGVCSYSYMIGALTNLIGSLDSRKAKLNEKLELLRQLGKEYALSKGFIEKLSSAVQYEHKNTNKDIDELVSTLPNTLRNQLLVTIHMKKIESNAFFEGKSDHFVAWLVPHLKPMRYDEDEVVYREGDPANEMYFLVRGEVEFVLDVGNKYVSYLAVPYNYYFGEVDLLFAQNGLRMHTTRTSRRTELLSLSRPHFESMLKTFQSEVSELLTLTKDRRDRLDRRKAIAEAEHQQGQVARHFSHPLQLKDRLARAAALKLQEDESFSESEGPRLSVFAEDRPLLSGESEMTAKRRRSRRDSVDQNSLVLGELALINAKVAKITELVHLALERTPIASEKAAFHRESFTEESTQELKDL